MTIPAHSFGHKSTDAIKKNIPIIIACFLLVYIYPLGVRPLVVVDETRYAEIPREMVVSGDWIVPRLNGLRYFEKPVLGYWLNALSIKALGENAFAVRLPAALATGFTALIIFILTTAFAGGRGKGLLAAVVFLTSICVFSLGVTNILDSPLAFFFTCALGSFFLAWHNRANKIKFYLLLLGAGISCGLACLTKGFLGLAVPLLIIVPFLVWQKEWKTAVTTTVILTGMAILVVTPWGIAIHMREPDFWRFFIWNEHIRRFLSDDAQHKRSFFYFFLVLPLGFFPWSALLPAAVTGLIKNKFDDPFVRFVVCWLVFPFLFFSVSSGKLATYVLPCFPPLAILTATGLERFFRSGKTALFNGGAWLLTGLVVLFAAALLAIQSQNEFLKNFIPTIETGKVFLLLAALLFFAAMTILSIKTDDPAKKICLFALAPIMLYFSSHFLLPEFVEKYRAPGRFLEKHAHQISSTSMIVSTKSAISAVCWYFKRDDVFLLSDGEGGELQYGLSQADTRYRHLTFSRLYQLIADNKETNAPVVLIIGENKYRRKKKELPQPGYVDTNGKDGFVLVVY